MARSRVLTALALAASVSAPTHARAAERAVAVTFDDLPAGAAVSNDVASLRLLTQKLLDAVRHHRVPAVGFVNEGKLFAGGGSPSEVAGRTGLLRMWLEAGLELGNQDNDEYVYAAVYADALRRGDAAVAARVGDDYLRYVGEVFRQVREGHAHQAKGPRAGPGLVQEPASGRVHVLLLVRGPIQGPGPGEGVEVRVAHFQRHGPGPGLAPPGSPADALAQRQQLALHLAAVADVGRERALVGDGPHGLVLRVELEKRRAVAARAGRRRRVEAPADPLRARCQLTPDPAAGDGMIRIEPRRGRKGRRRLSDFDPAALLRPRRKRT
jgi:hypothetical protein